MAGRPPKSLAQHVRDGTFIPSRHAELLATDRVPEGLEEYAERYRAAASARERRAIALEFRDAARGRPRGPRRIEIDLTPVEL